MPKKYKYLRIHLDPAAIRTRYEGTGMQAQVAALSDEQLVEVGEAALYSDRVHDTIGEVLDYALEGDPCP
jgi:hypothetical protein